MNPHRPEEEPEDKPPGPKLSATELMCRPVGQAGHEESLIDEAVDESFPASDPSAMSQPGGTFPAKKVAKAEPDPAKKNLKKPRK